MVEAFGRTQCPFVMKRNQKDGTEGFAFRAADVIVCLLKAGKVLDSEALTRAIKLAQSLDGALFTKNLSHTLIGVKFNDPSNPYAQSRDSVFPIGCIALPESTPMVHGIFARVFEEIREAVEKVLPGEFDIKQLVLVTNCDMSCDWKLMGRGGAAKQRRFPCSKCATESGKLHQRTNKEKKDCRFCVMLGKSTDPHFICRHVKMCTESHMAELKKEVKDFRKGTMPEMSKDLAKLKKHSMLNMDHDPKGNPSESQLTDIRCIPFDLSKASFQLRSQYNNIITNDLKIRRLDISGRLELRQQRLKTQLTAEWEFHKANETLKNMKSSRKLEALVMMLDSIPCLLHLENRMGIKFLYMCLKSGLTNTKKEDDSDVATAKFRYDIADIMRTQILGSPTQPSQWKVPFDEKEKKIGDITMDNVRIRKVLKNFDLLIERCISDPVKKQQFSTSVQYFREGLKKINVRHDLTDGEIKSFQNDMDTFYANWCDLYGEEGITNYAHMLGSAHVMEYLLHWRNLWIHSQQGWEGKSFVCSLCIVSLHYPLTE